MGAAALVVCANIGFRAYVNVPVSHPFSDNHGLDDRAGVRWLFAQRRADDAIVTSRLGQPAVWWYGNVLIDATARGGMVDSVPVFVVSYHSPHPDCEDELARALQGSQRALVYLGFRFDDLPAGFDDLFFKRLGRLGHVEAYRQFAGESVTAIVDLAPLGERPSGVVPMSEPPGSLDGCLGMEPGSRW